MLVLPVFVNKQRLAAYRSIKSAACVFYDKGKLQFAALSVFRKSLLWRRGAGHGNTSHVSHKIHENNIEVIY